MPEKSIIIDVYECNGCGSCAELCPDVFAMDESAERAVLLDSEAPVTEKVRKAAAYCAQKCIEFE